MFVHCSHGGPLSYGSLVVVFFDRGHPRFRNFYSIVPVDDARVNINSHMLTITLLNNTDLRTTLLTGTLRNVYAKPTAPTPSNTYSEKLADELRTEPLQQVSTTFGTIQKTHSRH